MTAHGPYIIAAASHWPLKLDYLSGWSALALFLLLAVPTIWLGVRSLTGQGPARKWVTISLRLAVLALLVLILAGARWTRHLEDLELIVVRDTSASTDQVRGLPAASLDASVNEWLKDAAAPERKPANDRIGVIRFARDAMIESLPTSHYARGGAAIVEAARRDGTDVASAIRLALSSLSGDAMHRIVLLWDGNQTTGDLDAAVASAAAQHVPIDVMPLEYQAQREVIVERLDAPAQKREGEAYSLRAVIRSTNATPVTGKLAVRDRGRPLDMDLRTPGLQSTRAVTLSPGLNVLNVEIAPSASGVRDFEAIFEADGDADTLLANNSARAFTFVRGRARVLYVDHVPDRGGEALAKALGAADGQGFAVDRIDIDDFPHSLAELQGYDAVVLANVPRGIGGLDEDQQRFLATYVHDLGGGLVMIGGAEGFGAGGWIGSDLEKVLPVDCSVPSRRVLPASLLVLVLDHSGSMGEVVRGTARTKQEIANQSAILALRALARDDLVGVVAFDSNASWVVPVQPNAHPDQIEQMIRGIGPGGGTMIAAGLAAACDAVEQTGPEKAAVKHVLLMTDGQSTGGDYDALVARLKKAGATLSTIGIGDDVNPQLLGMLARSGGGRYYGVADPNTLPQVFIREARSVRRTLIQERRFTPGVRSPDSPLLTGFTSFPLLGGLVLTTPKPNPNVRVALVSPDGDPVLAHWQAGLGRAVAFTSDAQAVWAAAWVGSDMFEKFWSQTIRWASRPPANPDFEVVARSLGNGRAKITVLAADRTGTQKNFLSIAGQMIGPDGKTRDAHLAQTGPGVYAGEVEAGEAGNYVGLLRYRSPDGESGTLSAGLTVEESSELRALSSDNAAMLRVVNRTRGRMLRPWDIDGARLFDREGLSPEELAQPIWDRLVAALIVLLLVDVAARRLAWGRQDLSRAALAASAWMRSFTTVRQADARPTLTALKHVRGEVAKAREEAIGKRTPAAQFPVVPMDSQAAKPQATPGPSGEEDGVAGLMAAKRRARRRFGG